MGTRNLTIVFLGNEPRIAQYGQWDGDPCGQGRTVLEFLNTADRAKFTHIVAKTKLADAAQMEKWKAELEEQGEAWWDTHSHISRDRAAKILWDIYNAPEPMTLKNSIGFAGDSLFCEWAYLIDLDRNRLEVYRGFNHEPLEDGQRFKDYPGLERDGRYEMQHGSDVYYAIRMVASYSLDALPTVEQMTADCLPDEEKDAESSGLVAAA